MLRYRLNGVGIHRRGEPDDLRLVDHARLNFHSSLGSGPK